jgi:type II secretion system protein G
MRKHFKSMEGFTLVELLVVIAIIGVLTTVTMANYTSSQLRARDTQRKNDFKILRDAAEAYKLDQRNATYPIATSGSNPTTTDYTSLTTTLGTNGYLTSPYPKDPKNTGVFLYRYRSDGSTFILDTCLENGADSAKQSTLTTPCTSANPNYRVTNP